VTWTVYHGCRLSDAVRLVRDGIRPRPDGLSVWWSGLCVTDTLQRAARYANARATGRVDKAVTRLMPHAAVVVIETTEEPRWWRRPEDHPSLDQAEWVVYGDTARVVAVLCRECHYRLCDCHALVAGILAEYRAGTV
jgi:hypothetical protein